MMMTPLSQTIQLQQTASDPQNSAWVFASAGSGKTKILTDRVLRLLLDDVSPNKILCLTFTKVAAAEMQNRINLELAQWILCNDPDLQKKLEALSGRIPTQAELKKARTLFIKILDSDTKIKVQTIHSFCQILIKIFPFEAKVKPTFEVMESSREKLLLKDAQKEVLKKALHNEELKHLVQKTNAKLHEESFSGLVATLLNKKEQLNFLKEKFFGIENVIVEIFKSFAVPKNQTDAEIFSEFLAKINRAENLTLALELENSGLINNGKIATAIQSFLENSTLENFPDYKLAFFTKENEPRKVSKGIEGIAGISQILNNCQKLILDFSDQLNSLKIVNDTALLLRFIDHILENYSQLKKQNSLLDYNDLIVETNNLLANPDFSSWVKLKMDSSFDHILIDESQDTNHQQWNIIKALSEDFFSGLSAANNERSIFIVGDEKQSIYSFQGAEPNISAEIFAYFKEKLGNQLQKIELNNSFRSTSQILKAVDLVFSDPQRKSAISKASEFQEHKAIREGVGKVEIWPQIQKAKEEKKERNYEWEIDFSKKEELQEEEILAEIIARKIKARVNSSAQYGDFMILLRNRTNGFSDALIKSFHQHNIPFSSVSKIKFSESLIICDLLAAAKFALLPHDDLNLACLLKSPIFEMSEEKLLEICLKKNSQATTIYQSLEPNDVRRNLDEIIAKSQELNCFEFFYFLLNEKNHQQNLIAHFGYESLEILDKFTLSVFDFCQNFSPNLQKFLEFIEKLDPEISLSDSGSDCVRISTIHSAKGLQAPIVILPDCCYNFNQLLSAKEEISWVEFNEDKFPIWCRKKDGENRLLKKHRKEKLIEAKEEYLRILYVAMTRPENELYVGGFGNAKDSESWYEVIKNSLGGLADFVTEEEFLKPGEATALTGPRREDGVTMWEVSTPTPNIIIPSSRRGPVSANQSQTNHSQIKGRLIHKILEIIGKNSTEDKVWLLQLVKKLIAKEEFLNTEERDQILTQATIFMDSEHFQKLFSGKIKCEVEVVGNNILGRIDLLIEKENEVLIIDYKSDETLPQSTPQHYIAQLKSYENLIKNLHPNKKISCAILWTKFLQLDFLQS